MQSAYSEKIRVKTINDLPSRTKQSLKDDADVNKIIKKYHKTGVMKQAEAFEGIYGDFDSFDLREAIEKVEKANQLFLEVPSTVRNEFNNDAGAFIDYATDPSNIKQMREWGLATPEAPPPPEPPTEPLQE